MNVIQDNPFVTNKPMIIKPTVIGNSLMKPPPDAFKKFVTPSSSRSKGKDQNRSSTVQTKSTPLHPTCHVIISLCEGRGKASGTIGLAAINIHHPTLILCELSDTQTYTSTLTKLNILNPSEILIPATFVESASPNRLVTTIMSKFPNVTVISLPRSEYNRGRGLSLIKNLCATIFSSVLLQINEKFYSLAAACGLLRYIEQSRKVSYCPNTIKVEYQELEHVAGIDIDTAELLELVSNAGTQKISLFSILDHCSTNSGKKLLRANILQPLCNRNGIETRLDCVQELLDNPTLLVRLLESLKPLCDIESCLAFASVLPTTSSSVSERQLNYTLQLKGLLIGVEPVANELKVTKHPVFKDIYARFQGLDTRVKILDMIAEVVNEDAHLSKGHAGELQRCFAIKSGVNGFLDLSRRMYTEGVDKMRAYVDELSETFNLPLRVQHTIKNGFHIILPMTKALRNIKKTDLPEIFITTERYSNHYYLTTMDMINFDKRLKNNSLEIQNISNIIIYKLLVEIRPYIGNLYQLCDDVALLDMLVSLAKASSMPNYVRPRLVDTHLDLEGARNPLLEVVADKEQVSNSVYAYPRSNLHIITGPNMSGKSILLHSICLIQVLAQLGCWVPCSRAVLRPADRIFARVAEDDSLTGSTFALETSKLAYLLQKLSDKSLVILDELCRTTACDEGVALAIAFCEKLVQRGCFSFVATHFVSLTTMENMYPSVTNWHLETIEELRANNTRISLKFTYRLLLGITTIASYGIKLSRIFNSSKSISDRAEVLYEYLLPMRKSLASESASKTPEFLKFKFQSELDYLKIKNKLSDEIQKDKIVDFQTRTGLTFEPSPLIIEKTNSLSNIPSSSSGNKKTTSSSSVQDKKIVSDNSWAPTSSNNTSSHKFSVPESNKTNSAENQEKNSNKNIFSFDGNDNGNCQEENFCFEPNFMGPGSKTQNINSQIESAREFTQFGKNNKNDNDISNVSPNFSISDDEETDKKYYQLNKSSNQKTQKKISMNTNWSISENIFNKDASKTTNTETTKFSQQNSTKIFNFALKPNSEDSVLAPKDISIENIPESNVNNATFEILNTNYSSDKNIQDCDNISSISRPFLTDISTNTPQPILQHNNNSWVNTPETINQKEKQNISSIISSKNKNLRFRTPYKSQQSNTNLSQIDENNSVKNNSLQTAVKDQINNISKSLSQNISANLKNTPKLANSQKIVTPQNSVLKSDKNPLNITSKLVSSQIRSSSETINGKRIHNLSQIFSKMSQNNPKNNNNNNISQYSMSCTKFTPKIVGISEIDDLITTPSPILSYRNKNICPSNTSNKFVPNFTKIQHNNVTELQNEFDIQNISINSSPILNTNTSNLPKFQNKQLTNNKTIENLADKKKINSSKISLDVVSPILTKNSNINSGKIPEKNSPKLCLVSTLYNSLSSDNSQEIDDKNEEQISQSSSLNEEIFSSYLHTQPGITSTPKQQKTERKTSPDKSRNKNENSSIYYSLNSPLNSDIGNESKSNPNLSQSTKRKFTFDSKNFTTKFAKFTTKSSDESESLFRNSSFKSCVEITSNCAKVDITGRNKLSVSGSKENYENKNGNF